MATQGSGKQKPSNSIGAVSKFAGTLVGTAVYAGKKVVETLVSGEKKPSAKPKAKAEPIKVPAEKKEAAAAVKPAKRRKVKKKKKAAKRKKKATVKKSVGVKAVRPSVKKKKKKKKKTIRKTKPRGART